MVSYIDVYSTLAEIIDYKMNCNEAPDSRSLMPLFKGDLIKPRRIIHHAPADPTGAWYALRDGKWKFIDSNPPKLFDLENDLGEENDIFDKHGFRANRMKSILDQMVNSIQQRENRTQYGLITECF